MASLAGALLLFVAGVAVVAVTHWLRAVTTAGVLTAPEMVPFAGGYEPEVHAWNRFHARYYIMAVLFLAFDMEMVFMYPWAVVYVTEGMTALVEMLMFIAVLLVGVLYAWREGAFRWH